MGAVRTAVQCPLARVPAPSAVRRLRIHAALRGGFGRRLLGRIQCPLQLHRGGLSCIHHRGHRQYPRVLPGREDRVRSAGADRSCGLGLAAATGRRRIRHGAISQPGGVEPRSDRDRLGHCLQDGSARVVAQQLRQRAGRQRLAQLPVGGPSEQARLPPLLRHAPGCRSHGGAAAPVRRQQDQRNASAGEKHCLPAGQEAERRHRDDGKHVRRVHGSLWQYGRPDPQSRPPGQGRHPVFPHVCRRHAHRSRPGSRLGRPAAAAWQIAGALAGRYQSEYPGRLSGRPWLVTALRVWRLRDVRQHERLFRRPMSGASPTSICSIRF